ncbi:hypothetical protein PITC_056790 [Penicillium italicum]|uniref:Uncharacterized protein n=1 Tax=Penicillium italicum TaxID=40296 RepID=A0A0A2L0J3_PENIT|nr:hypothetical protein PITC_056790 [Penicillium italicum]
MAYPKHLVPKAPAPPKAAGRPSRVAKTGQTQNSGRATKPGRVSKEGRVTKPVQASKKGRPAKPGQAPKQTSPKKKTRPQKEVASENAGNDSEEEYPPLPPSRDSSHTGITPGMSVVDINDDPDRDTEMPEADPDVEPFSRSPTSSAIPQNCPTTEPVPDATGSDSSSDDYLWFGSARPNAPQRAPQPQSHTGQGKRARVEDIEHSKQEHGPASKSIVSPPSKRPRTSAASLPIEAEQPTGPGPFPTTGDSAPASSDFDTEEALYPMPSETTLDTYREKGAQLMAWLEDPNEPDCDIEPATATLNNMFNAPPPHHFQIGQTYYRTLGDLLDGGDPESTGLNTKDNVYRFTSLSSAVTDPKIREKHNRDRMSNSYAHLIGPGLIIGHSIFRYDNIQWNEIARALYVRDHPIETLRHVMFTGIVNEETGPYIRRVLYPRFGRIFDEATSEPCLKLERGTREFEELLGTKLGRITAILLLSTHPRGTVRIARAVVWNYIFSVQLRFEIEPIPTNPHDEPETA